MKIIILVLSFAMIGFTANATQTMTCLPSDTYTVKVFNKTEGTLSYSLDINKSTAVLTRNQDGKCIIGKLKGDVYKVNRKLQGPQCEGVLLPRMNIDSLSLVKDSSGRAYKMTVWERFGPSTNDLRMHSFICF